MTWRGAARARILKLVCGAGLALAVASSPGCADQVRVDRALAAALVQTDLDHLKRFYGGRRYAPLWTLDGALRPEAGRMAALAGDERLTLLLQRAASGRAQDLAEAEIALSMAMATYALDAHRPAPDTAATHPASPLRAPPATPLEALRQAARASSLSSALRSAEQVNPLFAELRRARNMHGPASDDEDADRLIALNLERLRALPPDLGERYLLVDIPAERLWLYERGRPVDSMKVIVGSRAHPTPLINGAIRYLVFQPYWNVPPDLVRDRLAPLALSAGPAALEAQGMEALSDWSSSARPIPLDGVDWAAVARGERKQRVRQKPGAANMMGEVKFMMPNRLGVYLHDTPDKRPFTRENRLLSAGCVRVEDAARLARWLLGEEVPPAVRHGDERRLDLAEPVPVYLVYRTIAVENGRLKRRPDIYGLDAAA